MNRSDAGYAMRAETQLDVYLQALPTRPTRWRGC